MQPILTQIPVQIYLPSLPKCILWEIPAIGLMSRVFANGPGDQGSIPGQVIPKTQKMAFDAALLSTQQYKVRIKGKVEQPREWSSTLPLHLSVVAVEKGAFGSPMTNFTYLSLANPRNLAVTVRLSKGIKKCIKNKWDKKSEVEKLTFVTWRRSMSIFLKNKTTSSHKVIYFKRNKLYKIRLCIFSPMLVENVEFKVTKITYIWVTTILYPKKRRV